ncbi:MAG: DUF4956 domain-containing protein [Anaerolineae bacterium]
MFESWHETLRVTGSSATVTTVLLSLGIGAVLSGALSIVRFRTPIKEPEELAYLFAAIALGIGIGARQYAITLTAFAVILLVVALRTFLIGTDSDHDLFLNLELGKGKHHNGNLHALHSMLAGRTDNAQVRRLDVRDGALQATYRVQCDDSETLLTLMDEIRQAMPDANISFVEQQGIPAL